MKYPQSLFTKKIAERIKPETETIIDAPCGNGQTARELATYFPKASILGLDISEKDIKLAQERFQLTNLNFQCQDIHSFVENTEEFEIFCLINSLFLLPEPEGLLRKISLKLKLDGQLFLVLPNPQSSNFRRYQKIFPKVNTFILERKDYEAFFEEMGLKMLSCDGIARIPFYGRRDTKVLYPIRDSYLFWLEKRSKSEDYGYFLIVLSKHQH